MLENKKSDKMPEENMLDNLILNRNPHPNRNRNHGLLNTRPYMSHLRGQN